MHSVFASGLFNISLSSVINFALVPGQKKAASVMRNGGQRRTESGPKMYQAFSLFSESTKEQLKAAPSLFHVSDKLCSI